MLLASGIFWLVVFIALSPILIFVPKIQDFVIMFWKGIGLLVFVGAMVIGGIFGFVTILHYLSCTTNC